MAGGIMTPAIERKLGEYRAKYGTDFLLCLAEAPASDEAARIAAIDRQIKAGVPQEPPEKIDGFY
ncbi:MAG: hypothetical protein RIN56_07995 [Sporomusaceae bacterium]|nr:hypothetical protein [Sporomusaceae bacterium]